MSTLDQLLVETSTALVFAMHHNESNSVFQYDIIYNEAVQAAFCFVYALIFILGIFGNALVCYVVVRNRAMQTVTNLFITNLALSDILLCSLAVPFTPLYTFLGKWIFGSILCHVMPYTQACSMYISTLTLTSIAVDRFFVIIYPFKPRMRLSTCSWIIISIWTFAVTVTFPYGFYMKLDGSETETFCEETWPSDEFRKAFGALTLIMQFVLPLLIIAYCYTCVSVKLNNRFKTKPGSKREDADRERKRRTNRMLIAMVAIFGICWLPLNLINMFNDFYLPTAQWRYNYLFFFISHTIAMSSTCYNPFLYAWLNENFRKEFKNVLPCYASLTRCGRKSQMNKLGMYRSEKTGNGNNDTMQETLLTSTTPRVPSIRYKPEMNATDSGENATNAHVDEFVIGVAAKGNDRTETEDCMKMYNFNYKTVGLSESAQIVSQL